MCRWSTCTPSAPAAARSPASTTPGMLQVGPQSAGATPGPICYGRGGTRPTITDANLVLGRLNPARLLAVDRPVSTGRCCAPRCDADRRAARPRRRPAAAAAIVRIANDRMAGADAHGEPGARPRPARFRAVRVRRRRAAARGRRSRASSASRRCWSRRGRASPTRSAAWSPTCATTSCAPSTSRCRRCRRRASCGASSPSRSPTGERRSSARGVAVEARRLRAPRRHAVPGPEPHPARSRCPALDVTREACTRLFEAAYWQRFQVELKEIRPVLVNLHTAAIGERRRCRSLALVARGEPRADARRGAGPARAPGLVRRGGWLETRRSIAATGCRSDAAFDGPAIIEQLDCTTVIEPGNRVAACDALGNLRRSALGASPTT